MDRMAVLERATLVELFIEELSATASVFLAHKSSKIANAPPSRRTMPPVAGEIMWLKSLQSRIRQSRDKLAELGLVVGNEVPRSLEMESRYQQLMQTLGHRCEHGVPHVPGASVRRCSA